MEVLSPVRIIKQSRLTSVVMKLLHLTMAVMSVALFWRVLEIVKGANLSIMIVTQEDMRPAFQVGDLAVVSDSVADIRMGDIAMFEHTHPHEENELVLRRLVYRQPQQRKLLSSNENETRVVTKADFNRIDDRFLYQRGRPWETADKIKGKVEWRIPYIGMLPFRMLKQSSYKWSCTAALVIFMLNGNDIT